jgi:pantothenate kinase
MEHGGRLLGIAGPPGSGKSTVSAALAGHIAGAVVVTMDGFHLDDAELTRLERADRKGAPDTFDAAGFVAMLERIHSGVDVYAPVFDRDHELSRAGALLVRGEAPLVIVEGNYLLLDEPPWQRVAELCDEMWMIDVDATQRRQRLIDRHVGHGRSIDEATAWVDRSDEANAQLITRRSTTPDALLRIAEDLSQN